MNIKNVINVITINVSNDRECSLCPIECTKCISDSLCTSCIDDFVIIDSPSLCIECSIIENCSKCSNNQCIECDKLYILRKNKCQSLQTPLIISLISVSTIIFLLLFISITIFLLKLLLKPKKTTRSTNLQN